MKGIALIAKTVKGERALRQAMVDNEKAPFLQRQAYKNMYAQTVLSEKPFTLRIEHRQKKMEVIIPAGSILAPVEFALKENGAKKDVDYLVVLDE